jgi:predicted aconitase
LQLSADQQAMLDGADGEAAQWALAMQVEVGRFFGAERMVPVTCAHMMGDMEVMGDAGLELLRAWAGKEARFRVPITTNARCVDFAVAERLFQNPEMVRKERELIGHLRAIGVMQTDTCINYQTVYQPHFGEHVAWGDTGTVIYANSVLGARSNFESGPAAFAAGLTGCTPRYGFHEPACRRGTVLVELTAKLTDLADWGALGAAVGRACDDYWQIPVLDGIRATPSPDQLKHLGASLASYGSLAMFHMTGVTPEARTLDEAFHRKAPERVVLVDQAALEAVFAPTRRIGRRSTSWC